MSENNMQIINNADMTKVIIKAMLAVDAKVIIIAGDNNVIEINVECLELPTHIVPPTEE